MNINDKDSLTRNIDVSLVRAFVTVAEHGSMTVAARVLNLTQGAVSQQIKRLEDLFGKRLINRDNQKLSLSADGERLMAHARKMLSLNDQIYGVMTAPEFEGEVRLGMPQDIITPFAAPILKNFHSAWPQARIELVPGTSSFLKGELAAGKIDLTLTTEQEPDPGAERLARDRLVWVGVADGRASQQDPLPVSFCQEKCIFRSHILSGLEKSGRNWRIVNSVSSMDSTIALLKADLAVTTFLKSTVPDFLTILPPDSGLPDLPDYHYCLYLPKSGASKIVPELARHIREQFDKWFSLQVALAS